MDSQNQNPSQASNNDKIDVSDSQSVPINYQKNNSSPPEPPTATSTPNSGQPTEAIFTPENQPASTPPVTSHPAPVPPVETPPPSQPLAVNTLQGPTPPPQQPPQPPAQIDTGQYDIGNQQPIKPPKNGHPIALISIIAILFLGLGFGGGFYGYKYVPKLKSWLSTSADTTTPTTDNSNSSALQTYTNTKYNYSIQHTSDWTVTPSDDTQAKTVQFTSYKPDDTGSGTGYKVEIVFQDSNGKNLKDWIAANNVTSATSATPTTLMVDGQNAYQQNIDGISKSINTFILRVNQIMIISYSAPDSQFSTGKVTYDQMIQSIKLTQ